MKAAIKVLECGAVHSNIGHRVTVHAQYDNNNQNQTTSEQNQRFENLTALTWQKNVPVLNSTVCLHWTRFLCELSTVREQNQRHASGFEASFVSDNGCEHFVLTKLIQLNKIL